MGQDDGVAEISKLDLSVGFDQDVVGLNVSMNDILPVQVDEAFAGRPEAVLAEVLRVLALELFEHGCECAAIHQLHEDPQPILIIERLVALNDRLALAHLHDADLVFNGRALRAALRLRKLQSK